MTLKEYLHSFNITLEAFSRECRHSIYNPNKVRIQQRENPFSKQHEKN